MSIFKNINRYFKMLLSGAILLGWSANLLAHHPEITAGFECDTGSGYFVNYTASTWNPGVEPGNGAGNTRIDILLDGVLVDSGSFDYPEYSFSGTIPVPASASGGDILTLTALAVDNWDNGYTGGQSKSISGPLPTEECIPPTVNGRFTGGGSQIRVDGVRVTRGLTVHCDLLLSNNLEVNWNGKQFHMTEHLNTVQCSDDPAIIQFPPDAPLDTLIGIGTGRYQNQDGYTIEFTLVDAGEPGSFDEMAIHIYETANPGNVVLHVPQQRLDGGNLQAHFDQPHK